MEMVFPIKGGDNSEHSSRNENYFKENKQKIKEYLQAIILNALISEIELYLKPRLKFRASQFFIDTLMSFIQSAKGKSDIIVEEEIANDSDESKASNSKIESGNLSVSKSKLG